MAAVAYNLQVVLSITLFQEVIIEWLEIIFHPDDTLVSLKLGSHFPLVKCIIFMTLMRSKGKGIYV